MSSAKPYKKETVYACMKTVSFLYGLIGRKPVSSKTEGFGAALRMFEESPNGFGRRPDA